MIRNAARLRQHLWWVVPVCFCLYFQWPTLRFWFRADDFAWLGLGLSVHNAGDLTRALFEPQAQGTSRFLSERGFFLLFERLFGMDALPFRIAVLAAHLAGCVLLAAITRILTGSNVAAGIAPILWTISAGLNSAIGWLSSSNQIWFSLFFLAAFLSYLKGRWIACWVFFLLGFGTLESIVVFPVVCLAHAMLFDRATVRPALVLLIPSVAFAMLHFGFLGRINTDPAYRKFFDPASLATTLHYYWVSALNGATLLQIAVTAMVLSLAAWTAWRRNFGPLFGLIWFLLLLAPVLPLRDHQMLYYLAAPGMALGYLMAALVPASAKRHWLLGLTAAFAGAAVAWPNQQQSRWIQEWHHSRTLMARSVVRGVEDSRRSHGDKAVLLEGISNDLFWDVVFDNPFRLLGISRVYLAPGSEAAIDTHPEWGGINEWVVPPLAVRDWFAKDEAVVYAWNGSGLANVTEVWRPRAAKLEASLSAFVDAGDEAFARQLGAGWYQREENRSRWMGRRAKLVLNASRAAAGELIVSAYAPGILTSGGPVELAARIAGAEIGRRRVTAVDAGFELVFPVPAGFRGREKIEIELEASRTIRPPGEDRDLSFVFGTIQVR